LKNRSRSAASAYSICIVLALVNLAVVAFDVVWSKHGSHDYRVASLSLLIAVWVVAVAVHGVRVVLELRKAREREQYVAALQQQQLREAQRIARVGSWHWTASTNESVWSDEMYRIIETDPATTTPSFESYLAHVHPDDRSRVIAWREKNDADRSATIEEHRLVRADGSVVPVNLRTDFSYGPSGDLLQVVGTVQDITERKRVEESLRISEERFALASRATNEVIWDWNPATNLFWCSDAFAERYGHARSDSSLYDPSAWLDHVHPDEREGVWRSFQNAIANGNQLWSAEYQVCNASGEWRDVFDRGHLLRNADGEVVRIIGASLDITERQRATAELARVHQQNKLVLNSTADGIFGTDREGRINLVNAAGARMFGYSVAEMIGKPSHALLHHTRADGTPYPVEDCPLAATLREGTSHRETDVFWRKDRTSVPVEWSSNPMIDNTGAIVGVVVTCTDITERLKIDRMKDEFVSTVSHELRTPLTAIRGALGLLSAGIVGTFPEKAQRLLEIASTNTDRLVRLINDILDLEKIDSGKLELSRQPVPVDDLLRQTIDGVRPLLERAKITAVVQSATDLIDVDPDRIIQTLTNLVSNAIKFSPEGSTIRVSAQRDGAQIAFSVADEGRGIPPEKLEAIFERFEQVDASDSRDKGGSGLGLAISRSIVQQHGGTIHAESQLGRGSTFVFTIPAPLAEETLLETAKRTCDPHPRPRALMVDDDVDLGRAVATLFEPYNVAITHANMEK